MAGRYIIVAHCRELEDVISSWSDESDCVLFWFGVPLCAIHSSQASFPNLDVENSRMKAKKLRKPYDINTMRNLKEVSVPSNERTVSPNQKSSKATGTLYAVDGLRWDWTAHYDIMLAWQSKLKRLAMGLTRTSSSMTSPFAAGWATPLAAAPVSVAVAPPLSK